MAQKREREEESTISDLLIRSDPSDAAIEQLGRESGQIEIRRERKRCFGCRRKVGLMGFMCKCGDIFCWEHRYSDRHDCGFDYKAAGRVAIARENPVIRPAKVLKV